MNFLICTFALSLHQHAILNKSKHPRFCKATYDIYRQRIFDVSTQCPALQTDKGSEHIFLDSTVEILSYPTFDTTTWLTFCMFMHRILYLFVLDHDTQASEELLAHLTDFHHRFRTLETMKMSRKLVHMFHILLDDALNPELCISKLIALDEDNIVILLFIALQTCLVEILCCGSHTSCLFSKHVLRQWSMNDFLHRAQKVTLPLAHRMGMGHLKSRLGDALFCKKHPDTYEFIESYIRQSHTSKRFVMDLVVVTLNNMLINMGIQDAIVTKRHKSIHSIAHKMKVHSYALEDVYDVFGVRIICDKQDQCSELAKKVAETWHVISYKDFISSPKQNGYQSIHMIVGVCGIRIEVQLRTTQMHQTAELGCAAHYMYQQSSNF